MDDDLLHGHDLLPALLDIVVVLPHHYLPVPGLLAPIEAVAGAEHPLVTDQGAAAGEAAPPLEIRLPRPGARHCLVTSDNPEQSPHKYPDGCFPENLEAIWILSGWI